jgi:hypothetical protein
LGTFVGDLRQVGVGGGGYGPHTFLRGDTQPLLVDGLGDLLVVGDGDDLVSGPQQLTGDHAAHRTTAQKQQSLLVTHPFTLLRL